MTAAALARRGYEALARRDLDEILAVLHPDVELATVGSGTFTGHEGIRSWIAEMDSGYEDWTVEVEDVIAVSEELVVLVTVLGGRGRLSGIEARIASRRAGPG
jgi:ketosteroid isomerase-like protein